MVITILIERASSAVHHTPLYLLLSGHMVRLLLCILGVRGGHVTCSDQ